MVLPRDIFPGRIQVNCSTIDVEESPFPLLPPVQLYRQGRKSETGFRRPATDRCMMAISPVFREFRDFRGSRSLVDFISRHS